MNIRDQYLSIWQQAYDKLNTQQQKAVNTIDGPVMTIAGPGTGKTQLLAVRIGNILLKTDTLPQNILCLTYTEAGVVAMRQRLQSFIGPEAYNVGIYTFHAFCNSVIKENMNLFTDFRDMDQLSEVEEVEVYRAIIDKFGDDHPLKRYKDEYYEKIRLKSLFSIMKQERWTHQSFVEAIAEFTEMCASADTVPPQFAWKVNRPSVGKKIGDPNDRLVNEAIEKYSKSVVASAHFEDYQDELKNRERYDFQDMILMVINKFAENDNLLAKYQERYQYIMVDEYQDTNGAQNELLFQLASYWDSPNLFIVGDDDQSIFRFQGANMSSIVDFKTQYNPVEIVLTDNYRSAQVILDRSAQLIDNNNDRLTKRYSHLSKNLIESREKRIEVEDPVQIILYENQSVEEIGIIRHIEALHKQGVAYNEIAVIYSKHKYVEDIVQYFMQKNVPLNIKKKVNVLKEIEIEKLLTILRFLDIESRKPNQGRDLLFKMMHFDYFNLNPLDIASLALALQHNRDREDDDKSINVAWRKALSDREFLAKCNLMDVTAFVGFSEMIEGWLTDIHNMTLQVLFQKILTDSGCINKLYTHPDKTWYLQVVNTFFDFIKDESAKQKTYTLSLLLETILLMEENDLTMSIHKIISDKEGIHFLTAHGSKGLEFDHVFIIKATESCWEKRKGTNTNYTLPYTLVNTSSSNDIEDDRRLFYVSMTRAANHLYITSHARDLKDKALNLSKFVVELKEISAKIIEAEISSDDIVEYKTELMRYKKGTPSLIDNALVDRILEHYSLSVTHLNKYLKCKTRFYFENILRVPMARNAYMGFGNVIHYAFEHFFRDINLSAPRSIGSIKSWIDYLVKGMDKYRSHFTPKEFENFSKYGALMIEDYYKQYQGDWFGPRAFEIEYEIRNVEHQGVPITGKLDRIDIYDDRVQVVDYKTGKSDKAPKLKRPTTPEDIGGDYWRQIVFYRFLIDGDRRQNWNMSQGALDFLEMESNKDKLEVKIIEINGDDMAIVSKQITETYAGIKAKNFTPGCGEKDCEWCNFVLKHMPISQISTIDEI
jgi:DNA helicase II / ATP-dependent DNA helicase PcrA